MPSQLASLPLSLIKDTRTRTNRHDRYGNGDDDQHPQHHKSWFGGGGGRRAGGPILPVYKSKRRSSGAASGAMARNTLWSPYYAPRRRSKRLVLLWLGAFFVVGFVTWWCMSTFRRGEPELGGAKPPERVPVVKP